MFYKELYIELGKLFYLIASVDGKVSDQEKETLQRYIQTNWKHFEDSKDRFGTDNAHLIDFSFEYQDDLIVSGYKFSFFEKFYSLNKESFTALIIQKIMFTSTAIAESYRGENEKEKEILDQLHELFNK